MDNAYDYAARLQNDLLEQFRGHPNIEVLNSALSRQLQDVYDFFLRLRTVLLIDLSEGEQLDHIGEIVQLSRKEAAALADQSSFIYVDEDAEYRTFLHYKIFLNSTDCTYKEIMRSINMLWDGEVTYAEEPQHPATIILGYAMFTGLHDSGLLHNIPILKPGGVGLLFRGHADLQSHIYTGASVVIRSDITLKQDTTTKLPAYLLDEENNVLLDEDLYVLCEEPLPVEPLPEEPLPEVPPAENPV